MRTRPEIWQGPDRISWLCCFMQDFVGTDSLEQAPALLSGMGCVLNAPALRNARQAIFNIRQLSLAFVTKQAIKHAVAVYNEHHFQQRSTGPYRIDAETLKFSRTDDFEDPSIAMVRKTLSEPLEYASHGLKLADPSKPMSVQMGADSLATRVPISPIKASIPAPRAHNLSRRPAGPITVPMADLRAIAAYMDARDASEPNRRPGNWSGRFADLHLMQPCQTHGLLPEETLRLDGIKHLLGLPGSGKTTLLMLLAVWMARQPLRLMMLFPSIEVARQYMADLQFYDVAVGMLVGQNPATRRRHADRIAEAIAASGDQRGFGRTVPGADNFAANCVLPAFSPDDTSMWAIGYAPCEHVLQGVDTIGHKMRPRLCPVWTVCGRNKAPRELVDASVWVGHVLSMDTSVPPHALTERIRYFELVARTFDVVVFDEADMVQNNLDEHGAAVLKITGTEGSLHEAVQSQVLRRLAATENHRLIDRATQSYTRDLAEFGNHNNALVHAVQRAETRVSQYFSNRLLTTGRMITEILDGLGRRVLRRDNASDDEIVAGFSRSRALADFWDWAAYSAFYDRNGLDAHYWPKSDMCAKVLGVEPKNLFERHTRLSNHFRRYLSENLAHRRESIELQIATEFLEIAFRGIPRPAGTQDAVRLLISVTFMVLGYQRIVPGTRTLLSEGLLKEPVVQGTASPQLRTFVPENILGSLSGVRYSFTAAATTRTAARNVEVTYVAFVGAPRMLMHRFHRLLEADGVPGPAVLMTSATSFLEASPAYHIECGPHYVLKRKATEFEPSKSTYRFKWIPDRQRGEVPLRYSGAGELAPRNLESMVDALVRGGTTKSEIYKSIRNFDVRDGVHRKAALVVNGFDQCRAIKRFLDDYHREVGRRAKAVVSTLQDGETSEGYITPSQVEAVGDDDTCDILIFPMLAIGRGVNIVFTRGPRVLQAAIGSIYFLTRPHPSGDDLQLLHSLAGRASQQFDSIAFGENDGPGEIATRWRRSKQEMFRVARRLLEEPLMASRLGAKLFRPFTANQMVAVLQTIGRGMRGGCPVAVYFVDAAWAPRSTEGEPDSVRDSMLVQMRAILEDCVSHPDTAVRAVYQETYGAFLAPFQRIEGLVYPKQLAPINDTLYDSDGFDELVPEQDF